MAAGGELRASRESVIDSSTVRPKDYTDPNGNEHPEYNGQTGGPHPPSYSEVQIYFVLYGLIEYILVQSFDIVK